MTTRPMKTLTLPVNGENVTYTFDPEDGSITTEKVEDEAITAPKLNNSLWDKLLVSEEASGNPASFDDGADDVPVSSLKVNLEPVQLGSGDPSPSNIRPIIAANGKNMMPSGTDGTYTDNGITCVCEGGVYKLTGTSTGSVTINIPLIASVDLSPSTNKIAFFNSQGSSLAVGLCRNGTRIHYWTMSNINIIASGWADSGNEVINEIRFSLNSGVTLDCTISPMLMLLSDNDYSYQPYQGIMVERCGRNLFGGDVMGEELRSIAYNPTLDTVNKTLTFTNSAQASGVWDRSAFTNFKPNTQYTAIITANLVNAESNNNCLCFLYTDGTRDSVVINSTTKTTYVVTSASGKTIKGFGMTYLTNKQAVMYYEESGIFEGVLTASDFEPFTGNTYPYSLGQSVYGGTVDLATGVLTVTHGYVDMGSLVWQDGAFSNFTSPSIVSTVLQITSSVMPKLLAENLKTIIYDNRNASTDARIALSPGGYLDVRGTSYENATAFKAAVNGVKLVYELATPTTVQLTPQEVKTLLGYNNISSSGTVDVIYHADTKLYVDKMTAVDNAIIAPTEEGFTATRNYTVNDLVIVADTLYKVTANIQNGGTITPNSNVTATTLSALIKALS